MDSSNQKPKRDVLFWSGGKDSFLALRYYMDYSEIEPVLLTTYDDENGLIPHQNIPIARIRAQALFLKLTLFTVPLSHPVPNEEYVSMINKALQNIPYGINRVVFGDLHLQEIRTWREEQFKQMGFKTMFPIWNKPYQELIDRLQTENIPVVISGVAEDYKEIIHLGDIFNRDFIKKLPTHIDPMGEKGEFHTEVLFDV